MQSYTQVPTLIPVDPLMDRQDSDVLRQAMKGLGTDEQALIDVIAHRTSSQRQIIRETYSQVYERDLVKDLKSENSGHFKDVLVALMTPMPLYLAQALKNAIHKKNANTLMEVLYRDKASNENIKKAYMEEYGTELTEDLKSFPPARFGQFVVAMVNHDRSDVTDDLQVAKYLSQKLFDAGAGKSGISVEDEFMRILTKFNYPMLRLVFKEYLNIHGTEFQNLIDTKISEELTDTMKSIYLQITSPPAFLARELHSSMIGIGTDDPKLIRLVVSRCEIDMENIKEEYEKRYNTSLEEAITADTTRDYRRTLLALIAR
ncbi:unnamed protein product [Meganyctiphanes norvegica]|uniref:Annexin n=1 Tax=Meganyctiphanes norvegica TaxID=48144 RepID=A0AAV2Q299_MEGNR